MNLLMVCHGNTCRSPAAEAAVREALDRAGLADRVTVASAGTGTLRDGEPRSDGMIAAAGKAGLVLTGCTHRVTAEDLEAADLVLAMDRSNLRDLLELAGHDAKVREKAVLFQAVAGDTRDVDVPDPYGQSPFAFTAVVDMVRRGADGVVAEVRRRLGS